MVVVHRLGVAREAQREQQLGDQRPTAASAKERRHEAVEQRGPDELPGVGHAGEGEQADLLDAGALILEPRGDELQRDVERHARREPAQQADEHAPVEDVREEGFGLAHVRAWVDRCC